MANDRNDRAYEVAAYYFPNYHPDARNERWHGKGWTEWELMKVARPRFEWHQQPKEPLWGYEDESDPLVMGKKIDAAADHGLTAFLFDWYWFEDGPFLQNALEKGFLGAPNSERLKFALMWANHDWQDMHPIQRMNPNPLLLSGKISPEAFRAATDRMIRTYFPRPNYWRVNGGLYVSFYELMGLIRSFGTVEQTRALFDDFRQRVRAAGLGELHLNAVVWGEQILPGEEKMTDVNVLLAKLGFDSITSYVWIHHRPMPAFPRTSYAEFRELSVGDFEKFTSEYELPYFPNVTMGWDCTPRTIQSDVYDDLGHYPFMSLLDGNTPEQFELALKQARQFLDRGLTKPKILTINAWNEWTEGSYLEPDRIHGMKYLEAIRGVFPPNEA